MELVKEGQCEPVEVFENDIDIYIKLFCEEQKIDDLRAMPQSVWNGCLMYIRKNVFPKGSDRLKDKNIYTSAHNDICSNFNRYNYGLVNDIVDIYIYYCTIYDKEVSIMGFSYLTGIDTDTINEWGRGRVLGSLSAVIHKKLFAGREESLSSKLATGNKNPVGILAILNRHYAWNLPGVSRETEKRQVLGVDELPKIGQIAQKSQIEQTKAQDIVVGEQ